MAREVCVDGLWGSRQRASMKRRQAPGLCKDWSRTPGGWASEAAGLQASPPPCYAWQRSRWQEICEVPGTGARERRRRLWVLALVLQKPRAPGKEWGQRRLMRAPKQGLLETGWALHRNTCMLKCKPDAHGSLHAS